MKDSNFTFLGYRLKNLTVQIPIQYPGPDNELSQKVDIKVNVFEKEKFRADIELTIAVTNTDNTLDIVCCMVGGFKAIEMDDKLFEKMCSQNAPAILFPIIRSIIISVTAQAGIPPVMLPVVNFTAD
jgi:preprotein translocase subunit SecB